METLFYLGKVNICWILFYACYWLLFRKNTFFKWNRAYLITTLLLSFLLPLAQFPETDEAIPAAILYSVSATANIQVTASQTQSSQSEFDWTMLLWIIPLLGSAFMSNRIYKSFRNLFSLINQGEPIVLEDYTLILLPSQKTGSFSFLKWLVINKFDYENHPDEVIRHELVHIKQWHSIDILLIEFLKILFWFNPVLWFYKNSLQEVHEFLADEEAPDRDHYARFLVSYSLSVPVASLTNHFFNSSILKARIQMIYKNRNSRWLLGKYLMIIPVLLFALLMTAARKKSILSEQFKTPLNTSLNKETEIQEDIIEQKEFPQKIAKADTERTKINIEGDVLRESGLGIPEVTIFDPETNLSVVTDPLGHFKMANVSVGNVIVVSHVSYIPQVFVVEKSKTSYAITFKNGQNELKGPDIITLQNRAQIEEERKREREIAAALSFVKEQKPEFPGGEEALSKYIQNNIKYPQEALRVSAGGIALVSFTINSNGDIRKPKVVKEIGWGIDDEAVRLVLNMPKWEPARQNGRAVAMEYTLSIHFKIETESKKDTRQGFLKYNKSGLDKSIKLDDKTALTSMRDVKKFFSDKTDFTENDRPTLKTPNFRIGMYRYSLRKKEPKLFHFIEGNSKVEQ